MSSNLTTKFSQDGSSNHLTNFLPTQPENSYNFSIPLEGLISTYDSNSIQISETQTNKTTQRSKNISAIINHKRTRIHRLRARLGKSSRKNRALLTREDLVDL
jgi:hypothetical protein